MDNNQLLEILNHYKDIIRLKDEMLDKANEELERKRRELSKVIEVTYTFKELTESLQNAIINLNGENRSLRTEISLMRHTEERNQRQQQNQRNAQDLFGRIAQIMTDTIENDEISVSFRIPAHVRNVYLQNTDNQNCGICLETMEVNNNDNEVVLTECGHIFHSACLERHNGRTCPICRSYIS